jgi:hypothetical protein
MISYYKQRISHYKIDLEEKYFEQINQSLESNSIGKTKNSVVFEGLSKAMSENTGGEWQVITEEQFNQVKSEVLAVLTGV